MADAKSATRGRRHDSNFAKVLAGPHYWISVKTKSGRVVRIPIAGKSRRAAGKTTARKATVRPFKGTQGRDVEYRAKGQGGAAARPAAAVVRERFGKQVADAKLKTRFIPYTKDQSAAIAERLKTAKSRVKFHRGSINDASFAASTLAKGSGVPQYVAPRQTGFVIESARPTTGAYVVATKAGMRKVDDAAARSARAAALRAQRASAARSAPAPASGLTAEQQRNRERAQAAIAKSVNTRLASAQKRAAVSLGTGKPSGAFDAVADLKRRAANVNAPAPAKPAGPSLREQAAGSTPKVKLGPLTPGKLIPPVRDSSGRRNPWAERASARDPVERAKQERQLRAEHLLYQTKKKYDAARRKAKAGIKAKDVTRATPAVDRTQALVRRMERLARIAAASR